MRYKKEGGDFCAQVLCRISHVSQDNAEMIIREND